MPLQHFNLIFTANYGPSKHTWPAMNIDDTDHFLWYLHNIVSVHKKENELFILCKFT